MSDPTPEEILEEIDLVVCQIAKNLMTQSMQISDMRREVLRQKARIEALENKTKQKELH